MFNCRKSLAVLLAALMLFSFLPLSVFAGEFAPMPVESAGNNIKWEVDGAVLKISGSGEMTDFCVNGEDGNPLYGIETGAPWRDYRDTVTTLVIGNGVTTVGSYAFNAFSKLSKVYFPKTLSAINNNAFDKCDAIKAAYFEWKKTDDFSFTTYSGNDAINDKNSVWGVSYASTVSYTVKFSANGGTGTVSNKTYQRNKSYTLPANTFKKDCYVFSKWNTKKDGSGTSYSDKASVNNLVSAGKTVTLYAQWKLKSGCYTVKYNLNGGKNSSANPAAYSSTGKDITLKNASKSGYSFDGWFKKSDFSGGKVTKITAKTKKNVTLYAKWVKSYKIQFVANGGTGKMSKQTLVVGKAEKLSPNTFKQKCYSFAGWNTKKDGSGKTYKNKATVKNLSNKNGVTVKLYAKWKLNKNCYTVKYTLSGGTNNSANPKAYSSKGGNIALKNPSRTGYTFKGWYSNGKFTGSRVTKIISAKKKNLKLYAKWAANKYTVKFSANGGTGTMKAKTYTYDAKYTLPANAFKKGTAYSFTGWNTKKDGTGKTYKNKASVKNLTAKNGAAVTLYAQWKLSVTDSKDLSRACEILRKNGEPLYLKLQGQNVSYKRASDGTPIWSVATRANGVWNWIYSYDSVSAYNSLAATYCSGWGTPYISMSAAYDDAEAYRSALLDGTYDFKNDPGNVYIGWSMYGSSTEKADFQKAINNKISDTVFNEVKSKFNARTNSTYGGSCVIIYGKDSNGNLIGKYAGSVYYNNASNATVCYFVGINPKNTADYGKTVSKSLIY